MGKGGRVRLTGLAVLIDNGTYVDTTSGSPLQCVVMVTEKEAGDDVWRLPRIRLPDRIVQAGPQTMAEYVREEMSKRIGFAIPEPLIFEEELIESDRTFLIFSGPVRFTVATDSIYSAVAAKSIPEMEFLKLTDKISRFHHEIAKRLLSERS